MRATVHVFWSMCDRHFKPIDIHEGNIEQTIGHWKSLIEVITSEGRIPYITLNFAAINFLYDQERIMSWQHFVNDLCDYAHGIAIIDKGVNFLGRAHELPASVHC